MKVAYLLSNNNEESNQIYNLIQSNSSYVVATLPVMGLKTPELSIGNRVFRGFQEVKEFLAELKS